MNLNVWERDTEIIVLGKETEEDVRAGVKLQLWREGMECIAMELMQVFLYPEPKALMVT